MIAVLRHRNFTLLWAGGLISQIGDWALFIALPMYVYRLTGSTLATSGTFLSEILPSLALSAIAGVYADRWNRRTTIIVVNLLLALALLPLLAVHAGSIWIVYAVAFGQAVISQFLFPAWNALLPELVPPEDLVAANSLRSINASTARLVGPAVGGIAAAVGSLGAAALIDSASFIAVAGLAALVTGVTAPHRDRVGEAGILRAFVHDLLAGFELVRANRVVAALVASNTIVSLGEGVFGVMFVVWVRQEFNGGTLQLGWFMSAQAIGGVLGGLAVAHLGRKLPPAPVLGLSTIAFGLMDMALFTYPLLLPGVALGLGLIIIVGFPGAATGATWNALLQTNTEEGYRGRIYGLIGATSNASTLIGTILAGTLGGLFGPITMLNLFQGGTYLLAGGLVLVALQAWRAPAPAATLKSAS
jgi:MFS family permease